MNLTTSELVRELEYKYNGGCTFVNKAIVELEDEPEETIDGNTDQDYTDGCVSNMQEVAGEDFHSNIIQEIRKLKNIKKMVDREEHINYIVNRLNEIDREACDLISTIQQDGVIL